MRSTLEGLSAYLAGALDVPVYTTAPQSRPDSYVLIDPVGGTPSLDALHNDYAIQAWSKSYDDAEEIVRECCDLMAAYGATPYANPVPLGFDGTFYWWQATYTVHALW